MQQISVAIVEKELKKSLSSHVVWAFKTLRVHHKNMRQCN